MSINKIHNEYAADACAHAAKVIAETPAESLKALRDDVIEACAKEAESATWIDGASRIAIYIRELKKEAK